MDFVDPPFLGNGIEVPFVPSIVMGPDVSEWAGYQQHNQLLDANGNVDVARPQEEIAGFMQSWLYFGLLSVLNETTVNGHDLATIGNEGNAIVSSQLVACVLIGIKLRVLRLPRAKCSLAMRRQMELLDTAEKAVSWAENCFTGASSKLVDLILLSVRVLIGTVVHSYDYAGYDLALWTWWDDSVCKRNDSLKAASRALETHMMENGWCVHQIRKIFSTFGYNTAYYFARLPRPRSGKLAHGDCTPRYCKGWNSKPGNTCIRHETETCSCSTISVCSVEVAKIIRSGRIPLVSIEEDVNRRLSLKLHIMESSSTYTAISHVWADGLGNTSENGLPACQLRMLKSYLDQISKSRSTWLPFLTATTNHLFWMDTLCIPVQVGPPGAPFLDEDLNFIKSKAIDKMNVVYSYSTHTLVLDEEMRMIPSSVDHSTKLAYSQCCGWTTRSWTLQEGCLPPSIVYALADDIYGYQADPFARRFTFSLYNYIANLLSLLGVTFNFPSLAMATRGLTLEAAVSCFSFSAHRDIWCAFSTRHFSTWNTFSAPSLSYGTAYLVSRKYAQIWNELLDRVSSQSADTPAIFANLLGVSAHEVLQRKTEEERMALIVRQQEFLPLEILYNTGPRLRNSLLQAPLVALDAPAEETIGLLDMSPHQTRAFKNGWVPAKIDGDRMPEPIEGRAALEGHFYLKVLEFCLRIYQGDEESSAAPVITWEPNIPTTAFLLRMGCQSDDGADQCMEETKGIMAERVYDESAQHTEEGSGETVLGHCFMFHRTSYLAMCRGDVNQMTGAHLVILSRSGGRLTTRYIGPMRWTRLETSHDMDQFPKVKCDCHDHSTRYLVDILYDADDLGPKLSIIPQSPGILSLGNRVNVILIFPMHFLLYFTLRPYHNIRRIRVAIAMGFFIPIVVYLYQRLVVGKIARRLFLEPINNRGRSNQRTRFWTQDFGHRVGRLITHPLSVILFGPVLDGLFWLVLKLSQDSRLTVNSKVGLFMAISMAVQCYSGFALGEGKITTWLFRYYTLIYLAAMSYKFITSGLARIEAISVFICLFQAWLFENRFNNIFRGVDGRRRIELEYGVNLH